jgi:hypothetical protein
MNIRFSRSIFSRLVALMLVVLVVQDGSNALTQLFQPPQRSSNFPSFACQALAAQDLSSTHVLYKASRLFTFWQFLALDSETADRRGMRLPLGSRLRKHIPEKLLARVEVINSVYEPRHKPAFNKASYPLFDQWLPALRAAFIHVVGIKEARIPEFLSYFRFSFYTGGALLSYFRPVKSHRPGRKRGLGFNNVAFHAPALLTLLVIPHELFHAVLSDQIPAMQEVAALLLNVEDFLALLKSPSEQDKAAVDAVSGLLRIPPKKELPLWKQLLFELKALRESVHAKRTKFGHPSALDPAWADEHSLYRFFWDIHNNARGALPDKVERVKHVVSYILNNPDLYPEEYAVLHKYESASPTQWSALTDEIYGLIHVGKARIHGIAASIAARQTPDWPVSPHRGRRAMAASA